MEASLDCKKGDDDKVEERKVIIFKGFNSIIKRLRK